MRGTRMPIASRADSRRARPLVDVSAADELLARPAPEIDRAHRIGARGGIEIDRSRISAPTGVRERLGELLLQPDRGVADGFAELESEPEERGGVVERERGGRSFAGLDRALGGAIGLPRPYPVRDEDLRIGAPRRLERARELGVLPLPRRLVHVLEDRLAWTRSWGNDGSTRVVAMNA